MRESPSEALFSKNSLLNSLLYRVYATTRKSSGEMTRKLSVIRSRKRSHFLGTVRLRKRRICRSELGEGFIASIIGDMFVHYAPASFDRIKMRTIGRDEVQPDPASRLPQPLTHQNRVVVGGVVKKDVDPFLSRIGGFDGD